MLGLWLFGGGLGSGVGNAHTRGLKRGASYMAEAIQYNTIWRPLRGSCS